MPIDLLGKAFPDRGGLTAGSPARLKFEAEAAKHACNGGNIPIEKALRLVADVGMHRYFGKASNQTLPEAVADFVVNANRRRYAPMRDDLVEHATSKFYRAVGLLGRDSDKRIGRYNFGSSLFGYVYTDVNFFARGLRPRSEPTGKDDADDDDIIHDVSDNGEGARQIEFNLITGKYQASMRESAALIADIGRLCELPVLDLAEAAVDADQTVSDDDRERFRDMFTVVRDGLRGTPGFCIVQQCTLDPSASILLNIKTDVSPDQARKRTTYRDSRKMLMNAIGMLLDRALGILAADRERAPRAHRLLQRALQERQGSHWLMRAAIQSLGGLSASLGAPKPEKNTASDGHRYGVGIADVPNIFGLLNPDNRPGLQRLLFYDSSGGNSS